MHRRKTTPSVPPAGGLPTTSPRRRSLGGGTSGSPFPAVSLLSHVLVAFIAFYGGIWMGHMNALSGCAAPGPAAATPSSDTIPKTTTVKNVFPETVEALVSGMARIDREDFASTFDMGVPLDQTTQGNQEVVLLYNSKSLPVNYTLSEKLSPEAATENCDILKVILTESTRRDRTCLALMGQWESYHVHKWMRVDRIPDKKNPINPDLPLRNVPRSHQPNGNVGGLPSKKVTDKWWTALTAYLEAMPDILERLKPIAESVAGDSNVVIVMVCNFGQSELLMNFVCSAKARGLTDVSRILLFATDEETRDLAEALGLTVFYDEQTFAEMPKTAARHYADRTFSRMMLAKVFCVQLISNLGYDLLFQDVDVVWYKNPLEYFASTTTSGDFDMYFQDDGAHSVRYAPYSPNTGFYYVRHNENTEYFFTVLLRLGDLIQGSGSHQSVLTTVLNEHSSWRGLRVKILSRDTDDFPGGFHFHRRKQYMLDLISGSMKPYVFHMSWTANKDNKQNFFEQLGDWFVHDQCVKKEVSEILKGKNGATVGSECCSAEPIVRCHYRDKPSKIPCKDSPPIDKGRASFW